MTPSEKAKARRANQRLDKWLERILASYTGDETKADRTRTEASMELEDLARFDPHAFWPFMEYVAESAVPVEQLRGLGWSGLYPLLRYYPDEFDKRIAGLIRRDHRFRELVREVDPDRVAPDIWRQIEAALADE